MVHGSTQAKEPDPSIWIARLNSSIRRIEALETKFFVEEIPGRYGDYFKGLVHKIFQSIRASEYTKDLLTPTKPVDSAWIIEMSGATSRLDSLLASVSALTIQADQVPRELFVFMDDLYVRFSSSPIPYLLGIPFASGTPFTQDFMDLAINPSIELFPEARRYSHTKELYSIYISPEIAGTPSNWPILIHEAAHILEGKELKTHERFYPSSGVAYSEITEANWALEIVCDIIATLTAGPIFGNRLLQNYLSVETEWSETHPPTKMRLNIISEQLQELGWEEEADTINRKLEGVVSGRSVERAQRPKHIDEILKELKEKLQTKIPLYNHSSERKDTIDRVSQMLKEFKPCIVVDGKRVNTMDLLNASHYVDVELSTSETYSAFQSFLGDMIRLTLITNAVKMPLA